MSKLGQMLVRERKLSESDRKTIRRESGSFRGSYARSVLALGVMNEVELANFFARKTSFKVITGGLLSEIDSDVLGLIPPSILRWFDVLPLRRSHGVLQVAMVDPTDKEVILQLEFFSGYKIKPIIATLSAIRATLADVLENHSEFSNSEFEGFLGKFVPSVGHAGILKSRPTHRSQTSNQSHQSLRSNDDSGWSEPDVVEEQSTMTDDSGGEVMEDDFKSEPIEANTPHGLELHESEESSSVETPAANSLPTNVGSSVEDMLSDIKTHTPNEKSDDVSAVSKKGSGIDLSEWEAAINGPEVDSLPLEAVSDGLQIEDPSGGIEAQTSDPDPKLFDDLNVDSEAIELAASESLEKTEEPVASLEEAIEVQSPVVEVSASVGEVPSEVGTPTIVSKVNPAVNALNRSLVKLALISELGPACQTVAETAWKNGMKAGAVCFVGEVGVVEGVLWKTSEGHFTSEPVVPKNFQLQDALSLVPTPESEKIWHLLTETMGEREVAITESWRTFDPAPNFGCAISVAKGFIVSFVHFSETQDEAVKAGFVEVLRALSFKL